MLTYSLGPFSWIIGAPIMVATILVLMWQTIWDYSKGLVQRHHVGRLRRNRRRERKKRA